MIIAVANAADLIVLFAFILHLLFLSEFLRGLSRASVLGPFAPLHLVIAIPSPTGHDGGVFLTAPPEQWSIKPQGRASLSAVVVSLYVL
jgi:hypothetical protein